jgi:lysophospholipase L1-like esterase
VDQRAINEKRPTLGPSAGERQSLSGPDNDTLSKPELETFTTDDYPSPMKEWAIRSMMLAASITLTLGAAEVVLRLSTPVSYYVWRPGTERVFHPDSTVMPGVHGVSHFTINSTGVRGDDFANDQDYRILAVGGSTTECLYLDDSEAWPMLLQAELNHQWNDTAVWVGNVAKSGHSTRQHVHQVERLLEQYPPIDAVILLVGINDFIQRLASDTAYRPLLRGSDDDLRALNKAFASRALWDHTRPFYKRTVLWDRLAAVRSRFTAPGGPFEPLVQDHVGRVHVRWREYRAAASAIRDTLPDLTSALAEFIDNLRTIIETSAARSVRVILVTQPSMFRVDLPPEMRSLLWMGGVGEYWRQPGSPYYSVGALERGIAKYNRALLELCETYDAECIDLASQLDRDTSVFYDDVHFNENGARQVAQAIARYLSSGPTGS